MVASIEQIVTAIAPGNGHKGDWSLHIEPNDRGRLCSIGKGQLYVHKLERAAFFIDNARERRMVFDREQALFHHLSLCLGQPTVKLCIVVKTQLDRSDFRNLVTPNPAFQVPPSRSL